MEYLSVIGTIIKFGAMSALPIACWILFFQKQNPENRTFIFWTFVAGMLAVLPIKVYEKIWNISVLYFEHINMFKYIADLIHLPSFPRIFAFVLVSAIVATAIFFAVAILMFLIEVCCARANTIKSFNHKFIKISESPLIFLMVGILFGISAYFLSTVFPSKIWFFVVVGMIEEFVKYLMLRFADEEKIKSVSDAISFSIVIALGFAFIENIIYLARFWENVNGVISSFSAFYLLRSTISVIAHVCFSAILGYFYGVAHFSSEIYKEEVRKNQCRVLRWIHRLFHIRGSVLFHEAKLLEGMLLAMVVHAIFNSLLELGQIILIFPLLFIVFTIVLNLLHRKSTHIRRGILSRRPKYS
jgi:RsiW-degrading membrane proteinase PrsW (M82 family)